VATFAPRDAVELLTAWRVPDAGSPVPDGLAIFVHGLDVEGQPVAQGDALAALSDTLRPGDVFVRRHQMMLPGNLAADDYRLLVGRYVCRGARPALDSGQGDVVVLTQLEVRR
jgi:hypothetical protein